MRIQLGNIANRFDGQLSLGAYLMLGKLVTKHGPLATIEYTQSQDTDQQVNYIHEAIAKANRSDKHVNAKPF